MNKTSCFFILLSLLFCFSASQSDAWIYPEHREMALMAIKKLDNSYRISLERIWAEAIKGHEKRLSPLVIDTSIQQKPQRLDFASWPAIAGDHSCSPQQLLNTILYSDWILKVEAISSKLNADLEKATIRSQRINAIRNSDLSLLKTDPNYATRAGSNNVHFLIARERADTRSDEYFLSSLSADVEINALGVYAYFHTSALVKACRYHQMTSGDSSALMLSALADEAFALHFLEDVYAAGHIAGTWGETSLRKGTHDYYNENGLDVTTWNGNRMVLMGDGYMRRVDNDSVSEVLKVSIEQFLDAASGRLTIDPKIITDPAQFETDTFNVCSNAILAVYNYDISVLKDVILRTPVPGLADGSGRLPRFRSELGAFFGISTSLNGTSVNGGFSSDQTITGGIASIEGNIRVGFGIDGVINEAGDGLVYLQVGLREDGNSTNQIVNIGSSLPTGAINAAIPGRSGYNARLRMPFYIVPGDLIIAAPILMLISPKTLTKMVVTASNGGLIPWQTGIATSFGRFQFVAGREIGLSFYGHQNPKDIIVYPNLNSGDIYLIENRSLKLDFPILEYRPFRSFSMDQSSSIIFQITTGIDIPTSSKVIYPQGIETPKLKSIWYIGSRLTFNWRHYFNKS